MKAGFLDASAAPTATTPTSLEEQLASVIKEAASLRLREAPEEQPYVHRYEERELLQKLSTQAAANAAAAADAERARAAVVGGVADGLLGQNFMDTEEPGSARPRLEAAVAALDGAAGEEVAWIDALNHLGVLEANNGEHEKALALLHRAEAAREAAAGAGNNKADAQRLDDAQTLTTFYLAQVCGALGRSHEAAAYCHATMQRQLARRGVGGGGEHAFVALEWAKNAASIATYYAGVHRYDVAEHCLRAAAAVLALDRTRLPPAAAAAERTYLTGNGEAEAAPAPAAPAPASELSEADQEAAASLDIAFVQLWLALLKRGWQLRVAAAGGEAAPAAEGNPLAESPSLRFSELKVAAPHKACVAPGTEVASFDGAREVYRLGAAHAERAKKHFILDGFVTDHFAVLNLESSLYAALSAWEEDGARRMAMLKRRQALLLPAVEQLNAKVYQQIVRQTRFDLGTIASDMVELKAMIISSDPNEIRRAKKTQTQLAPLVDGVAHAYAAFFTTFLDANGVMPTKVDEGSDEAFITAHFHVARARGKLPTVDSLKESLKEYEFIAAYLKAHPIAALAGEAQICDEMIELLPRRIAGIAAGR